MMVWFGRELLRTADPRRARFVAIRGLNHAILRRRPNVHPPDICWKAPEMDRTWCPAAYRSQSHAIVFSALIDALLRLPCRASECLFANDIKGKLPGISLLEDPCHRQELQ
jgi:hypothetical protein